MKSEVIEITKFDIKDSKGISKFFREQGYVVIKSAISNDKIDSFLEVYNKIKTHPLFVYYAQSLHLCMRPQLNEYGYIRESMQNASRLAFFKDFCQRFQECIYDKNVSGALTAVTGSEKHVSWQNMFFDQSTGTVAHQDSWYLDTEKPGGLVGVWFALEDIDQQSGPFFVSPKSHKLGLINRDNVPDHDDFVNVVQKMIAEENLSLDEMCLDKGDILLWHPFLIHGASNCQNPSFSRKSFTSHFYPAGMKAKDTESKKLLSIYDHDNVKKTINENLYSAYRFNDYFYNLIVYGLYVKNKITSKTRALSMRSEDYN